ncbi:MAG: CGGC domain-containing protein [Desulfobacterales bacterium]
MTKVAILRCEKNEERCPLTSCFKCLVETTEGFAGYDQAIPAGVFTCRCPGDNVVKLSKILKAKGAEAIHFCTCMFAVKTDDGWKMDKGGFCSDLDHLMKKVHESTGLPCVKGSAHLPKGYVPETLP